MEDQVVCEKSVVCTVTVYEANNWLEKQICISACYLELSEDVNEDAPVEGGLAVDRRHQVRDLLEGQRRDLRHDALGALHLHALERHQRLRRLKKD